MSNDTRIGGFILENAPAVDINGLYLLAGFVGAISLYLFTCWLDRAWKSRGKMSQLQKGKLRLAAATGNVAALEGVKQVCGAQFDVEADLNGFTALHAACVQGQVAAVLWLCQQGADVNAVKEDGWKYTPLHYAASQILCAFGADLSLETFKGYSAAQLAVNQGHDDIAIHLAHIASGQVTLPRKEEYDGWIFIKKNDEWQKNEGHFEPLDDIEEYMRRGNEGYGTPGTVPQQGLKVFRILAIIYVFTSGCYLIWRLLRSLNPGYYYFYSMPFWVAEASGWVLGLCFVYSLFYQIQRPPRDIFKMLEPEEYPRVDVFVVRYTEPVDVLEATVVAALNSDYPGDKFSVYILDDGKSDEVQRMTKRLNQQLKYMKRKANLVYVTRDKVKGVPHHAKAGNINNCLLASSSPDTDYILVLDCDMIIHPSFLRRTLGHFMVQKNGKWVLKDFAGLLQTPQDFWNVAQDDPMVHCARFFYGPMLQGRDGAGCCPCCGTGVIFKRDILVSIGGQSYGSITEDCNTAMCLLAAGFANMFLVERLVYGMAPERIDDVFSQRLRWATGAIQILYRDNPLRKLGLTLSQSFLFFEIGAHHYLSICTIFMSTVPLWYVYVQLSPLTVRNLWEFSIAFCVFYTSNRLMIWWAHRAMTDGGSLELWRGGQMWVWMSVWHFKSVVKAFIGETNLFKFLKFEISFVVTNKDSDEEKSNIIKCLTYLWPYLLYYAGAAGATVYFIVFACLKTYTPWEILLLISSLLWAYFICLCLWPPVSTMFPRKETKSGWKITWDAHIDRGFTIDEKRRVVRTRNGSTQLSSDVEEGKIVESSWSNNVGKVALPGRTLETMLQSGLVTSAILPEPSRISRTNSDRTDVRSLSMSQLQSQLGSMQMNGHDQIQVTTDGRVFKGDQEVGLEHLTKDIVAHFEPAEDLMEDFVSPFYDDEAGFLSNRNSAESRVRLSLDSSYMGGAATGVRPSYESFVRPSHDHSMSNYGANLIHSMSVSQSEAIQPETGEILQENRGEGMLGSFVLSMMLSEMRPSYLEEKGMVIPVVPEDVFDHTIAARPSFDSRKLPSTKVKFFLINGIMIAMVCAGGIVAIFYKSESPI